MLSEHVLFPSLTTWRVCFGLQVAGLSEHRAQPVHFTLKRAASSREVGAGREGSIVGRCRLAFFLLSPLLADVRKVALGFVCMLLPCVNRRSKPLRTAG